MYWMAIRVSLFYVQSLLFTNVLHRVLEMQTIIVTLLENFEFSPPPQTEKTRIYRKPAGGLMAPMVEGGRCAWMGLVVKSLEE
ncbi:hypothetical protein EDB92DRAFT_1847169 [Lactarius akahatsu]|uniref:Secreted protein n=1 Tax=Lactarius akahatsu TaxID=416441 RepID=A0AAD4QA14_9AGAM|nr:hypothetical protein EDB92DRAFT_1847169 [Lactarius akahatsu]